MSQETSVRQLILVPAVITLGVTLLRLVGELVGWSPALFNREAGGGGALVGIAWLVPVFGAWFGWKLARAGSRPSGIGRALGLTLLAFAVSPRGFVAFKAGIPQQSLTMLAVFVVASSRRSSSACAAWPALGSMLLGYGLAARIPVVLVMLVAMLGNWGTHYDVAPARLPRDEHAREVAHDRRRAPADDLDLVHGRVRRAVRDPGRGDRRRRPAAAA